MLAAIMAALVVLSMTPSLVSATTDYKSEIGDDSTLVSEKGADIGDYEVYQTLDIEKNGTVTVTLAVNGADAPDEIYLRGVYANTTPTIVDGQSHLQKVSDDPRYVWETTGPVTYRIHLADTTPLGRFPRGITEKSVWFSQRNIMTVQAFHDSKIPSGFFVTIQPPEGWNGAAPGQKIDSNTYKIPPQKNTKYFTPKDIYVVGDSDVHTTKQGGTEYRVFHAPSADGPSTPSEHLQLLASTGEVLGSEIGVDAKYGRLGIVVPDDGAKTGSAQARHHSYVVTETEAGHPIKLIDGGQSIYVHEIAHTYEWFDKPEWIAEGGATFLEPYALYKSGYISKSQYKQTLAKFASTRDGNAKKVIARNHPYDGGATVLAALDLDIRARTNGEKNVVDFFGRVFDQRHDPGWDKQLTYSETLSALKSITGADYSKFIRHYVDSEEQPRIIAEGDYSLAEGVKDPYVQSDSTSSTTTPDSTTGVKTTTVSEPPTTTEKMTSEISETTIQDSDGDGVIDSEDYAPRDPKVQEKSDLQTTSTSAPGIGIFGSLAGILVTLFIVYGKFRTQ